MRSVLRMAIPNPYNILSRSMAAFLMITLFIANSLAGSTEDKETGRGYLGVYMRKITQELQEVFDLSVKEGVFVSYVEDDSPADEADIKDGDVIIAFDGSNVASPKDLKNKVREAAPGQRAEVTIVRDGKKKNVEVVIGEQPEKDRFYGFYRGDEPGPWDLPVIPHGNPRGMILTFGVSLGVKSVDLNEDLAAYFEVNEDDGVLVLDVFSGSTAEEAGLKAGDVITRIDGKAIASVDDLKEAVGDLDSGDEFKITIVRHGKKERLEAVADHSNGWKFMESELMDPPGMAPPLQWFPKSFHDNFDEELDDLREELEELQEELKELKEKI